MLYTVDDRLTVNPVVEETAPVEEAAPSVEAKKLESFDGFKFWEIKVITEKRFNRYFGNDNDPREEALFKAALEAEKEGRERDAQALLDAALAESDRLRR